MLYPLADLTLARRLERAEANSNADFVETRARLNPASQTEWIEVAGAYAMFDSAHSPLTQTFGLGLFEPVTAVALAQIEAFFQARNAPVLHEISPLADPDTLNLLHERGYRPHELTSVMYRPISHSITSDLTLATPRNSAIQVRLVDESESVASLRRASQGWRAELQSFRKCRIGSRLHPIFLP